MTLIKAKSEAFLLKVLIFITDNTQDIQYYTNSFAKSKKMHLKVSKYSISKNQNVSELASRIKICIESTYI